MGGDFSRSGWILAFQSLVWKKSPKSPNYILGTIFSNEFVVCPRCCLVFSQKNRALPKKCGTVWSQKNWFFFTQNFVLMVGGIIFWFFHWISRKCTNLQRKKNRRTRPIFNAKNAKQSSKFIFEKKAQKFCLSFLGNFFNPYPSSEIGPTRKNCRPHRKHFCAQYLLKSKNWYFYSIFSVVVEHSHHSHKNCFSSCRKLVYVFCPFCFFFMLGVP